MYVERREQVEPAKAEQFCNPMEGINNGTPLFVTAYPVAWRVEIVNDEIHRGDEYVWWSWALFDVPGLLTNALR